MPIPARLPGERTSTEGEPAKSLYAKLSEYDERLGISDANPARMTLTDGTVNQEKVWLENRHRPAPSFPYQRSFEWHPVSRLSRRQRLSPLRSEVLIDQLSYT
ncbi:hypothetical protein [Roseibium aggregatum]|uniref:hypothetical protein n=1 Tax=Roseibium aggregatum TaxID=187304 RepID=UPI002D1FA321|nr:hypothetical protein [Roseibium aggregatum]